MHSYIELNNWQIEQIKAGIRQAVAGQLKDHCDVKKMIQDWRNH